MSSSTFAPIVKEITVGLSPEASFELFTAGMGRWWPLDSHSVGGTEATDVVFPTEVGAFIEEVTRDGTRHPWGEVLLYEESSSLRFSWFPGRDRSTAQEIEVTFTASGNGTVVRLVHSGWEILGDAAQSTYAGYDTGWDLVFGERYGNAAREAA